jgi:hypothetical protein
MEKVKTLNFQPKQNIPDHTMQHDPSQVEVPGAAVNHLKKMSPVNCKAALTTVQ